MYIIAVSVCNGFPNWLYVKSFVGFLTFCGLCLAVSSEESVLSPVLRSTIPASGSGATLLSTVLSLIFLLRINTNSLSDSDLEFMDVGGGGGCL